MNIELIVAMDRQGLIGQGNGIPWLGKLPADLARFKRVTMGHPVIMGRRTFESIGKALPGRTNIVISRDPRFRTQRHSNVLVARSRDEALALARNAAGASQAYICGGREIYELFLPDVVTMHITTVDHAFSGGGTLFPAYDRRDWKLIWDRSHQPDVHNHFPYTFALYDRY